MEHFLPIVYFVAGGLSVFLTLYLQGNSVNQKIEKEKKPWSKISKLEYTFTVDHTFSKQLSAQEMFHVMADVMKINIDKKSEILKNQLINPGSYSITCINNITFVHRESNSE